MRNHSSAHAQERHQPTHRPSRSWRITTLLAFALAGGLFATTALNSHGLDLRASSVTDLDQVVRSQRDQTNALQQRVATLNDQVTTLTEGINDTQVNKLQAQVEALRIPAGFTPVRGPGVQVSLDDAPKATALEAQQSGEVNPEWLVVHQQDIQAVVNALWSGGAEAMSIQGQRIVSTTGIKCVGNVVILHGVQYSPPYRIEAIGDVAQLRAALATSDYIAGYLTFVDRYQLGYDVSDIPEIDMAAYEGASDLKYAALDTTPPPSDH